MGGLDGRLVVVTGAGGNLGRAVARHAAARGARVFGLERRAEALAALLSEVPAADGAAADLGREASVEAAFEAAHKRFGPLWGVVHTVGTWAGGSPVSATDPATLEALLATNLVTTFLVARSAMRRLEGAGGGRLVTIGALTAFQSTGLAGAAAYNASKAAVISLTRALAEEGRGAGVFANCVAPGTMDTPQNRAAMPSADPSRWASLDEVAEVVVQALSPSSGLCGAVLPVPGRG